MEWALGRMNRRVSKRGGGGPGRGLSRLTVSKLLGISPRMLWHTRPMSGRVWGTDFVGGKHNITAHLSLGRGDIFLSVLLSAIIICYFCLVMGLWQRGAPGTPRLPSKIWGFDTKLVAHPPHHPTLCVDCSQNATLKLASDIGFFVEIVATTQYSSNYAPPNFQGCKTDAQYLAYLCSMNT